MRGQDRADHDTDAVMSGVMRGEAVTRSNVNWNTNTALNCLSERRRHKTESSDEENCVEVMERVDPQLSTPGETSN